MWRWTLVLLLMMVRAARGATGSPPPGEGATWWSPEDAQWGGPREGCARAELPDGWELRCALPAGRLTVAALPARRKLALECEDGAYRCSELGPARALLPRLPALNDRTLDALQVERCALAGPLACALAVVNGTGARALVLVGARGALRPEHVRGLPAVARLRLTVVGNDTRSVPYAALAELPALTQFVLRGASLTLAPGPAPPLPQLTSLELAAGELRSVPPRAFSNTPNLVSLLLYANRMTDIHEDALQGLSRLQVLSLNNNQLAELPRGLLRACRGLRRLELYDNRLARLAPAALAGLPDLQLVKVFKNNATLRLENGTFANLPSLKTLQLDSSGIEHLPEDAFSNSPLRSLSLKENKLTELPTGVFVGLAGLETLDLGQNSLERIPSGVFEPLSNLTHLILKKNQLQQLDSRSFAGLSSLKKLDLSENSLKRIPSGVCEVLGSLDLLDLKKNELEQLDSMSFAGLSGLSELDLSANKLVELHIGTFNQVPALQVLSLEHNGLQLAPARGFGYGVGAEGGAEGGADLPLSPFVNLQRLRRLRLAHNRLRRVCDDWRLLLHLAELDLSYNLIAELTDVDMEFLSAATVDLRHNNISRLAPPAPPAPAGPSPPRARLLLADNPYLCDCHLYPFAEAQRRLPVAALDLAGATCAAPPPLAGRPLTALDPARLSCALPGCPAGCQCAVRPARQRHEMRCAAAPASVPPGVRFLDLSGLNLTEPPAVGALEVDLRDNRLTRPPLAVLEANGSVWLAGNPLACDCAARAELLELVRRRVDVLDYGEVACADGAPLQIEGPCAPRDALVAGAVLAVGLAAVALLLFKFRTEIRLLLGECGPRAEGAAGERADDETYDLFVSFAHRDSEFVFGTLVPQLEGGRGLRLCLHSRDWVVGDWIPEQIARSVATSRRTLVVLSEDFLSSVWGCAEFREAHARGRVLMLVRDPRCLAACRDRQLSAYVTTKTYVLADDPLVWERVQHAVRRRRPVHPRPGLLRAAARRLVSSGLLLRPVDLDKRLEDAPKQINDVHKTPGDMHAQTSPHRTDFVQKHAGDPPPRPEECCP